MSGNDSTLNYWKYEPVMLHDHQRYMEVLLPHFENVCKSYMLNIYGKLVPSRRISVLYANDVTEVARRAKENIKGFDYKETPAHSWSNAPAELLEIKNLIEKTFNYKVDYVLCHIYRGIPPNGIAGSDYIGFHNDKEALNSEIFSVSLGASRRFQLCKLYDKSETVTDEYMLNSGDIFHMFGPRDGQLSCQRTYKHRALAMNIDDLINHIKSKNFELPKGRKTYKSLTKICQEHKIHPDRINLTFRQYEN